METLFSQAGLRSLTPYDAHQWFPQINPDSRKKRAHAGLPKGHTPATRDDQHPASWEAGGCGCLCNLFPPPLCPPAPLRRTAEPSYRRTVERPRSPAPVLFLAPPLPVSRLPPPAPRLWVIGQEGEIELFAQHPVSTVHSMTHPLRLSHYSRTTCD